MAFIPHKIKVLKALTQECVQVFGVDNDIKVVVNTDLVDATNFQDVEFLFEATNLTIGNAIVDNNKVVNNGTLDLEVTPFLGEMQSGEKQTIKNFAFLGLIEYPNLSHDDIIKVQEYDNLQFKSATLVATDFDAENGLLAVTIQVCVNVCFTITQEGFLKVNAATR